MESESSMSSWQRAASAWIPPIQRVQKMEATFPKKLMDSSRQAGSKQGDRFGHHWVHFSRHDRRAGLGGGQLAVGFQAGPLGGLCFEMILRLARGNSGHLSQPGDRFSGELGMRDESGAVSPNGS